MIGETTFAFYPKTAAQETPCFYHCFKTICQGIEVPSSNPFIFKNGIAYRTIQEQTAYSATDYFWRKYYSDLAMGFSRPTYFKHYNAFKNSKNAEAVQQYNTTTNLPEEPKELFGKNVQIWRPFSPPLEMHSLPQRGSIIPSINKLDHSTSSVFVPVKSHCPSAFHSSLQLSTRGSKPYACDYPNCSKSFARNEELTRHRRIHSGYKPHHCSACGKSFGRKDHLSKHLKTHLQASEKKVYVCRVSGCGHRYTRSDALTRHRSNAHAIHKSKAMKKL